MNEEEIVTFIKEHLYLELEYKDGNYFDNKRIVIKLGYSKDFKEEILLESTAWLN